MHSIQTPRLILRQWQEQDELPFAAMNADPSVMRHLPVPLSTDESATFLARIKGEFELEEFGLWAVELRESGRFAGYTGLHRVGFEGELNGRIEIGWRLCSDLWGRGYAPEAAKAVLEYARRIGIEEVVSFTATLNHPSQRVMQKIGMHYCCQFSHPALKSDHPLSRHILYTIEL